MFFGIEVFPGRPFTYLPDDGSTLRLTQATLGLQAKGSKVLNADVTERAIVQCRVGESSPVFLCSLAPSTLETCHLEFEFSEEVVFSVLGSRSVHLAGYYISDEPNSDGYSDEYDEDSDEYDGSFADFDSPCSDDDDLFHGEGRKKSGVIIEEIEDEKPANEDGMKASSEKKENNDDYQHESTDDEDEDGFPMRVTKMEEAANARAAKRKNAIDDSTSEGKKTTSEAFHEQDIRDPIISRKKVKNVERKPAEVSATRTSVYESKNQQNNEETDPIAKVEKNKKKKKSKNSKGKAEESVKDVNKEDGKGNQNEVHKHESTCMDNSDAADFSEPRKSDNNRTNGEVSEVPQTDSKKGKKKKKNKENTEGSNQKEADLAGKEERKHQPSRARTFGNGMIIEELAMGKPDGKRASPGKKVFVNYIGKLKNGTIFDSTVGKRPFKFRLGVGQVIKGWDVGVNGMRVGDKRRLTIPPAMGYGDSNVGKIPKNSWLVFDVELVDVQ